MVPVDSAFGIHLLLVMERTNCPKLDGRHTQLIPTKTLAACGDLGPSSGSTRTESQVMLYFLLGQTFFCAASSWTGSRIGGKNHWLDYGEIPRQLDNFTARTNGC